MIISLAVTLVAACLAVYSYVRVDEAAQKSDGFDSGGEFLWLPVFSLTTLTACVGFMNVAQRALGVSVGTGGLYMILMGLAILLNIASLWTVRKNMEEVSWILFGLAIFCLSLALGAVFI